MDNLVSSQLAGLTHWSVVERQISREFEFVDFAQAFDFITQIAKIAETMDHHPKWCQDYQRVSIYLTTHTQNRITQLDIDLAVKIDAIFNQTNKLG